MIELLRWSNIILLPNCSNLLRSKESRLVDLLVSFVMIFLQDEVRSFFQRNRCGSLTKSTYLADRHDHDIFPRRLLPFSRHKMSLGSIAPPWFSIGPLAFSTCRWCDDIYITSLASYGIKNVSPSPYSGRLADWKNPQFVKIKQLHCVATQPTLVVRWKQSLLEERTSFSLIYEIIANAQIDPPWSNDPLWHWWRLPLIAPHWVLLHHWSYHIPMPKWATRLGLSIGHIRLFKRSDPQNRANPIQGQQPHKTKGRFGIFLELVDYLVLLQVTTDCLRPGLRRGRLQRRTVADNEWVPHHETRTFSNSKSAKKLVLFPNCIFCHYYMLGNQPNRWTQMALEIPVKVTTNEKRNQFFLVSIDIDDILVVNTSIADVTFPLGFWNTGIVAWAWAFALRLYSLESLRLPEQTPLTSVTFCFSPR